ncbi:MAG: hypothetical protein GXY61_04095 [Lentisphaerae bacterium]|jgi:hypothetical protein|nr:hypothetical protein [Lentisphaerota bacterium]
MTEYKVHIFNRAVALPEGTNPPQPHPEIQKCSSLEDARIVAGEKSQMFEVIRIFSPDDNINPIEEYRNGVRYVDGVKSKLD